MSQELKYGENADAINGKILYVTKLDKKDIEILKPKRMFCVFLNFLLH